MRPGMLLLADSESCNMLRSVHAEHGPWIEEPH